MNTLRKQLLLAAACLLPVSLAGQAFLDHLPQETEAFFAFDCRKTAALPFRNLFSERFYPPDAEQILKAPETVVCFLSGEKSGFLFRSNGKAGEQKDSSAKSGMFLQALPQNYFLLTEKDSFMGKRSAAPALRQKAKVLLPDAAVSGVFPLNPELRSSQPEWRNIGSIAFSIFRKETVPDYVFGEVFLYPVSGQSREPLYQALRKLIGDAYSNAGKKGTVKPEMMLAFRVSKTKDAVRLDIMLKDADALEFVKLILKNIQE